MSNAEMDYWFMKVLYLVVGVITLRLFWWFVKRWQTNAQKARAYDVEQMEKKTHDKINSTSDADLLRDASKALRGERDDQ